MPRRRSTWTDGRRSSVAVGVPVDSAKMMAEALAVRRTDRAAKALEVPPTAAKQRTMAPGARVRRSHRSMLQDLHGPERINSNHQKRD